MLGFRLLVPILLSWLLQYTTGWLWYLTATILGLVVAAIVSTYDHDYWKNRGIFSPPACPLVGHILPVVLFKEQGGMCFKRIYDTYKNERFLGTHQFYQRTLVVRDPELIKRICVNDFQHFVDRGFFFNKDVDPLAGSVLFLRGTEWKKLRAKISPIFSPNKLRGMFPLIENTANEFVLRVRNLINTNTSNNDKYRNIEEIIHKEVKEEPRKDKERKEEPGKDKERKVESEKVLDENGNSEMRGYESEYINRSMNENIMNSVSKKIAYFEGTNNIVRKRNGILAQDSQNKYKYNSDDTLKENGHLNKYNGNQTKHDKYKDTNYTEKERFSDTSKIEIIDQVVKKSISENGGLLQKIKQLDMKFRLNKKFEIHHNHNSESNSNNIDINSNEVRKIDQEIQFEINKILSDTLENKKIANDITKTDASTRKLKDTFDDTTSKENKLENKLYNGTSEDMPKDNVEENVKNLAEYNINLAENSEKVAYNSENLADNSENIATNSKNLAENSEKCSETVLVDSEKLVGGYTADAIVPCAFGLKSHVMDNDNDPFAVALHAFYEMSWFNIFEKTMRQFWPAFVLFFRMRIIPKKTHDFFHNIVTSVLRARENGEQEKRGDFIDMMMSLRSEKNVADDDQDNDVEITDMVISANAFIIFLGGFETTSSTLAFLLLELAADPGVQERLRTEIKEVLARHGGVVTYEVLQEMTYMEYVIQETLRLYPPFPSIQRMCTRDYLIPGSRAVVQKGTIVLFPTLGIHRDEQYFPSASSFAPERWARAQPPPGVYMPFGDGPRYCIGKRFALIQMKCCLIRLLQTVRLSPAGSPRKGPFAADPRSPLTLHPMDSRVRISLL